MVMNEQVVLSANTRWPGRCAQTRALRCGPRRQRRNLAVHL